MQSHIRKVNACLAVTCHLHFWQDDRDLLRATAETARWNGYQSKSQHKRLTMEKKVHDNPAYHVLRVVNGPSARPITC